MLSIIIPYHNEGRAFISDTIDQIRSTIDISEYEIIIVDDGSDDSLARLKVDDFTILRHDSNTGVGAAFDTGVAQAKYDNLVLMGCDIRFIANKWASRLLAEIEAHPKAFTCTSCVCLNQDAPGNMDIEKRAKENMVNGATMLIFHDQQSNPKVGPSFRGILEAKWLPRTTAQESFEIPCILGAFYGVKKEWYNYVDGWAGHRKWGTLEPMISLKSWLFGGSCRVAPQIQTGHIFKKHGTHGTPQDILIYNKMMVATMLFDDYDRLIAFLGDNPVVNRGRKIYNDNIAWIMQKREIYRKKTVRDPRQLFGELGIDYRIEKAPSVTQVKNFTPDYIRKECNGIYSKENNSYAQHYTKSPYLKVWEKVASFISPGEYVVDIGCGPGQVMELMLDRGVGRYAGIDLSPVAISEACRRLSQRPDQDKVKLCCEDVFESEPLPKGDKYVMIEILEHLSNDLSLLRKVPEGKDVVITVPSFLGGSHVRKFDTADQVALRYSQLVSCRSVEALAHGSGQIFVLNGTRI